MGCHALLSWDMSAVSSSATVTWERAVISGPAYCRIAREASVLLLRLKTGVRPSGFNEAAVTKQRRHK